MMPTANNTDTTSQLSIAIILLSFTILPATPQYLFILGFPPQLFCTPASCKRPFLPLLYSQSISTKISEMVSIEFAWILLRGYLALNWLHR